MERFLLGLGCILLGLHCPVIRRLGTGAKQFKVLGHVIATHVIIFRETKYDIFECVLCHEAVFLTPFRKVKIEERPLRRLWVIQVFQLKFGG